MLSAEIWVAISFICFMVLFGKKIYGVLIIEADKYIIDIKEKIREAEKLREEASELLKAAYERKGSVAKEVEKCKEDSKEYMDRLRQENEEYLRRLEAKMLESFESDVKSSLSKRSEKMIEELTIKFRDGLLDKIASDCPRVMLKVSDLDKLKKRG